MIRAHFERINGGDMLEVFFDQVFYEALEKIKSAEGNKSKGVFLTGHECQAIVSHLRSSVDILPLIDCFSEIISHVIVPFEDEKTTSNKQTLSDNGGENERTKAHSVD